MEISSDIREYVGVPVNYSFGFGRCRVVSSVGGEFFVPEKGFDPTEIAEMLESDEINSVSAVPTLWRIVLANADLFLKSGNKLRWIEIGSQYMSRSEKERLRSIFPNAKIVQHYGLTEASRTTFLKIHEEHGDALETVGLCIDDSEVRISDSGKIMIRGSHVASWIIRNDEKAKITDEFGWFETSDLGRIENGYLFYEGRADDLINCGGIKISPEHLEQKIFNSVGLRSGIAVAGVKDSLRGQIPIVAYQKNLDSHAGNILDAFHDGLAAFGVDLGGNVGSLSMDELPKTATGKVQRRKISEQYELHKAQHLEKASSPSSVGDQKSSTENKIKGIWEDVLGIDNVPTNVSFFDLGGDSLSSISVALRMEKLGVEKALTKKIFEGFTIQQIAHASDGCDSIEVNRKDSTATVSHSINLVRGILVLLVVIAHWMPGVVERLPGQVAEVNKYLSTLYSFGTPGFAAIFGIGVGFFYLLRFLSSPESLGAMVRRNALILFGGMSLLALIRLAREYLTGVDLNSVHIANAYFSVLYFYFFAVISIPVLLKLITKVENITYAALQLALVFFAIHLFIEVLKIPPSNNGLIQAGVLLLTTKYNYFEMMAGLSTGVAIGNWIRVNLANQNKAIILGRLGCLLLAALECLLFRCLLVMN